MLVDDKEQKIEQKIQEITGLSTDINKQVCYDLVKEFREYKIKKILLLASSFDFFLIEEEGRLGTLFSEFCSFEESDSPPRITHVETEKQLIEKAAKERFDLIILFNKPPNSKIDDFTKKIKEKTDVPLVLLDNKITELSQIAKDPEVKIDKFFTWNGDGKIILSIVQYFEDKKNLENLSNIDKKTCILLVEDSIQHYSTYLSRINEEIYNHLKQIISEELNCEQKTLRFKNRPFVLHTADYDEGKKLYDEYKDDLLFIITDNYLKKDKDRKQIGVEIANKVLEEKPDLPIIIQSSEAINKKELKNKKAKIISKTSNNLMNVLRKFIKKNLGPNKLVFKDTKGKEIIQVTQLVEFQKVINEIESTSIYNSAKKHEISQWIKSIGEIELAKKCSEAEKNFTDKESLKKRLIDMIEDYSYSVNQSAITSFSQRIDDPYIKISRIGDGALGGKARGIAFIAKILSKYLTEDMFSGLKITVPRSIVLSTDIFDIFMERNNLNDLDFANLSDERISAKFMHSSLPATVLGDLRSFIRKTRKPLIARSSGLLEDSLMQPFAGIYASMLLPNESWETDLRFQEVCNAIKHVYASTYFEQARTYIKNTPKHIGDEKMAVLIQEIAGTRHGKYFYPTISGVAKSYNYYASGSCKSEEGIAYLALGLGKAIVDGGSSFAFCPNKPKRPLFGTPKDYMKYAQSNFYALNLRSIYKFVEYNEETSLDKLEIDIAKKHGILDKVVSTYIPQDDSLYPGIYENGYLVVDFSPILNYETIPLAKALNLILSISEIALGYPVEIEFALNTSKDEKEPSELIILQIRNMIPPDKKINIDIDTIPRKDVLFYSENCLGNGVIKNLSDIVYIDQSSFDMSNSTKVVNQIKKINLELMEQNKPYILIGPGRWGSSDPWLGIPVVWSDIAGAKLIVETPYKERHIDPSQGSHFFHDMIASQVGYIITKKQEDIDHEWLEKQETLKETEYIKHFKTSKPLEAIIDSRKGKAIIKKQVKNEKSKK